MNEIAKQLEAGDHIFHAVDAAKDRFEAIVKNNPAVDWESESMFAYQMISANSYIFDIAQKNRESVKNAVINVAAVGLSLNPATHYAYLVPRAGGICLDISYRGLIKIATDSGSIKWAKAELVYDGDEFEYLGPAIMPTHKQADPFGSRNGTETGLIGVYCVAKTHDGDFLVEKMSVTELTKIRDEASAAAQKGPWKTYFGEMCKKCVIKRAQKTWPMSDQHERLQTAVNVINETEGSDWVETAHRFKPGEKVLIIEQMREALSRGDAFGVLELVEEYSSSNPDDIEESSKFWALFNSSERACIERLTNDNKVKEDRLAMGKPELNEPLETEEL
jgi:recombination protein RecT